MLLGGRKHGEDRPLGPAVMVPLSAEGRRMGLLMVGNQTRGTAFLKKDVDLLRLFAGQSAIALLQTQVRRDRQRLMVMEERERLSRELHDGAIQSLYGLGLQIEGASALIRTAPEQAEGQLGHAVDRLNAAIADLRNYVLGLRPIRGSDRSLGESLPRLAAQIGTNALLVVEADVEPEADASLDQDSREAVFYVAADALGNVARHARARHVRLSLRREADAVVLEIVDDGVGFDTSKSVGGLGLRNMRERAFNAGARLDLVSAPGAGTRLQLRIPAAAKVVA